MEHDAVTTDVHSLSLNFSHILHYLPSGFLARIRRGQAKHSTDLLGVPSQGSMTHAIESLVEQATWAVGINPEATPSPAITDKIRQSSFPSAWAFFTSGYMVGLLVVGFILHRMQNIILPSRTPSGRRRDMALFFSERHNGLASRFSLLRHVVLRYLYSTLLPLDITRTTTRLAIQLPSVCLLSKMLAIWCLLVLQACGKMPDWDWIQRLGTWCEEKEMSEICWNTFCALGTAFCVEGFIRALDGMSTTFAIGPHSNPNASPFNLIGYAFLLYIYSSPVTHVDKPLGDLPSRPDKHVLITITIPLLQLTIFHYLSISKRLSSHRLIPTTLSSFLSLSHFHMTLYSKFISPATSAAAISAVLATPSTPTLSTSIPSATTTQASSAPRYGFYASLDSNSNYPLLNYIPNLFETLLLSTILLTVILNVIVQLLVRGRVERPFIGLGMMNGFGGDPRPSSWFSALRNLPWEEDFAVLLLRMSTASLEATGLRGWGNEVAPIPAPLPSFPLRFTRRRRQVIQGPEYGRVKVGRLGVESLVPARRGSSSSALGAIHVHVDEDTGAIIRRRIPKDERRRKKKPLEGYQNEVRSIDVGVNDPESSTANGQSQERRERLSVERRWLRAFGTFMRVLWGTLQGASRWLWLTLKKFLRGRRRRVADGVGISRKNTLQRVPTRMAFRVRVDSPDEESEEEREDCGDSYARFLAGDSFSDDSDDSTFDDSSDGSESDLSDFSTPEEFPSEEGSSRQVGDNGEEQPELGSHASMWEKLKEETIQLFSDLVDNHVGDDSSMLLAHLAYPRASGPLTRRRMQSIMKSAQPRDSGELEEDEDEFERVGREMVSKRGENVEEEKDDARHLCVICTVEERDIICWPCRCLAMCDSCRDVLSSRSSPSKHRCPCCRRSVEGYSKIYIP